MDSQHTSPPPHQPRRRYIALLIVAILLAPPLYYVCIVRSCRPPWELPEEKRAPTVLTGDLRFHRDFPS